jgi:hypothetical protein
VTDNLVLQSMRLWPNNPYLQAEWLRAVQVVRATYAGWVLEGPRKVPLEVLTVPNIIRLERAS